MEWKSIHVIIIPKLEIIIAWFLIEEGDKGMLQTTSVHMYMEILQVLATYILLYVEMVEIPTALIQHFSFIYFQMF